MLEACTSFAPPTQSIPPANGRMWWSQQELRATGLIAALAWNASVVAVEVEFDHGSRQAAGY